MQVRTGFWPVLTRVQSPLNGRQTTKRPQASRSPAANGRRSRTLLATQRRHRQAWAERFGTTAVGAGAPDPVVVPGRVASAVGGQPPLARRSSAAWEGEPGSAV